MTEPSLELPASTSIPDSPASSAGHESPEPESVALVLKAPAAVGPVPPSQAADTVPIDATDQARLDGMVSKYLDAVSALDTHGQAFSDKVAEIAKLGEDDIRVSAGISNRLLDKPLATLQSRGLTDASEVGASLRNLRRQVDELDPAKQGDLLSRKKLFGLLPFGAGDRLRDYFDKYRSSQHQIDSIIRSLDHGQEELQRDNAAIEQEKLNLWAVMGRLRQYAYLAQRLDAALSSRIEGIEATDPDGARVLNDDLLFPVRQKNQDLLTQLAVCLQGYLALDIVRHNNRELIRGVRRATTTTVSALRTAVIVAQAIGDQKLVLDQVTALNATTSNLIESTADLLHRQSGAISEQAASATVDISKLEAAFSNVYATMDELDTFKVAALVSMQKTVSSLSTEIARSQAYLDRTHGNDSRGSDTGLPGAGTR
jgi:uncharacterized protein YaaN involved in tellurite resistance